MNLGRALLLSGAIAATGCVSASVDSAGSPVRAAFVVPASELRRQADRGDVQAQLALGSLAVLQQRDIDAPDAKVWFGRVNAAPAFMPLTLYVPSYNGHSSSVSTTLIPRSPAPRQQVEAVRRCLSLLIGVPTQAQLQDALNAGACGGAEEYERLQTLRAGTAVQPTIEP